METSEYLERSHSAEKKEAFSAEDFRGKECRAKLKNGTIWLLC